MKKLLSILLMLCLMIAPVCAQAEANEVSVSIYAIDLYLGDPENPITLDTSLWLDFVQGDAGSYGLVGLYDVNDEPIAMAGIGADETGVSGYLDGMSNMYHLSQDALAELASTLEEELGMTLDEALSSVTAADQMSEEAMAAVLTSVETLMGSLETSFAPLEWTVGSVEEVVVLDEALSMQRQDLIIPEESIDQAIDALSVFLNDLIAAAPEAVELDVDDLNEFLATVKDASLSADISSWTDDIGNMRKELNIHIAEDGETFTIPLLFEALYGPGSENLRLSCELEVEGEYVYMVVDYYDGMTETTESTGVQIYAYVADEESYTDVGLYLSRDVEDGVTNLMAEIMTSDDEESADMGVFYSYEDMVADDGTPLHAAYVDLWVTTGAGTEYETTYEIDFLMDIYHGPVDEDGSLPVSDVGVIEIDQLTDEQMTQAQEELTQVLTNALTGLLADAGVQTLMSLFGLA